MQHRPWRRTGFQATTLIAVALLLLILFVTAGYFFTLATPGTMPVRDGLQSAFERNAELWDGRRPDAFEYVVERSCFCAPDYRQPYRVRESGSERSARYASPLAPDAREYRGSPPEPVWIEDLFSLVERAIAEADTVEVGYDPAWGFPTSISIDWSQQAADEEQRFSVRDFRVLEYRD
jgi:hypothetical protein